MMGNSMMLARAGDPLASVKDFLEPLFESTIEVSPIILRLIFIVGLLLGWLMSQ
jgi:hypothetical protein